MKSILIALTIAAGLAAACSPSPNVTIPEPDNDMSDADILNFALQPGKEQLSLLAIKYGVPSDKIETLVTTYRSEHDPIYRMFMIKETNEGFQMSELLSKERVEDTLDRLSSSLEIPREVLASIIMDYQAWAAAEQRKHE